MSLNPGSDLRSDRPAPAGVSPRANVVLAGLILGLTALLFGACAQISETGPCDAPERLATLPDELRESSGLAASRRHAGLLWSHNDSGHEPVVFGIDTTGAVRARVRIRDARNVDWEDLALGPCSFETQRSEGANGGADCLYIADTGDNRLRRENAAIYRVPEPAPDDSVSAPAERLPIRFPDGPRDVEAIYLLPPGSPAAGLYLVSKGRGHPIELHHLPAPSLRPGEATLAELRQTFGDEAAPLPRQVTGAAASPDGRRVAIRTYTALQFYRPTADGRLEPELPDPGLSLFGAVEPQGEAVELLDDGTVFLTSETGPHDSPAPLTRMRCKVD